MEVSILPRLATGINNVASQMYGDQFRKRLINTRSKYTNYSVPIKVGLEHFTPAYWKSGALFRALAFHRSILSFLTRA